MDKIVCGLQEESNLEKNNVQRFIDSIKNPNTVKVAKYVLNDIDLKFENFDQVKFEKYVLDKKPGSPKEIITICYILSFYAKWMEDQGLSDGSMRRHLKSIKKEALWEKAKPAARKKFISFKQYSEIIHNIGVYEDYNALYYEALFGCIYEGIYNDDLSVIKNMRLSDIDGKTITLHEDSGNIYEIEVSSKLADKLKELAKIDIWERANRFNVCKVEMRGIYPDSVFKVEKRKNAVDNSIKFSYYAKLRKISKDYLGYAIQPKQLYISGMMERVKARLDREGILLEDAFSKNNRDKAACQIIQEELRRCKYRNGVGNFKEIVRGHIDVFKTA